jgi:RNA polymerase sigma-32 factor
VTKKKRQLRKRPLRRPGKAKKPVPSSGESSPVSTVVEVLPPESGEEQTDDKGGVLEVDKSTPEVPPPNLPSPKSSNRPATPATDVRGVVPYDALTAYLREIRQYPKLTPEQEHQLAVRYYEHQDLEAAYTLLKSTLWLVVKISRDYERAAKNLLDLIQEGNIGLMEAVKNFDPYRGVRFPSYAVWWVKAYIIRYVMANLRMVKIGTTQAQRKLFFNLKKEKEKLEREGFYPGPKLLAEKLNVKESEVIEMEQRLGSPDVSVDAPLGDESDATLLSVMPSEDASAEDLLDLKRVRELLATSFDEFASTLNDKEAVIFKDRMMSEERATLQELSDQLGISRERVRQLEVRMRDKLKVHLTEKFGTQLESLIS